MSCAIPPAVELIGEKWAFLILRGALNGLSISRNSRPGLELRATSCRTGSARLVAGGILERSSDPSDRRKVIYALTAKGEGLLPVVLALRQWGEEWGTASPGGPCRPPRRQAGAQDLRPVARRPRAHASQDLAWIDVEGERLPLNRQPSSN